MAAKDEDGNVKADGNLEESGEMAHYLEEIFSNPLLYQALPDHEDESNVGEKKETTDTSGSSSLGVDRSIQNISDQETSNEQGTSTNQPLAVSSTTSNVPVTSVEASSSDVTNVKERGTIENDDSIELSKLGFSSSDQFEAEQSITTASSPGRSPSVPMTKTLIPRTDFVPRTPGTPQAMNPHYPQWQVPSGRYGNITRPPYSPPPFQQHGGSNMRPYGHMVTFPYLRPEQIYMGPPYFPSSAPTFQQHGGSNMVPYGTMVTFPYLRPQQIYMGPPYLPPSAPPFQQHGGSNMVPYGTMVTSPYLRPEQNDIYNYNMPQLDASMVPPYDVDMDPYAYGYANPFGTYANSRFGYEGVPGNYLSSIRQHQGGDSVVYPQGQQQQLPWSDDFATQNQQDDRSDDPSDQTQRGN